MFWFKKENKKSNKTTINRINMNLDAIDNSYKALNDSIINFTNVLIETNVKSN